MPRRDWPSWLAAALLWAPAAQAQQALVCFTLHNDLVNFDRRAAEVEPRWRTVETARETAERASRDYLNACGLPPAQTPLCESLHGQSIQAEEQLYALQFDYARSPLGGADPVRQRIMRELFRHHCLYEELGGGRVARRPAEAGQAAGPPITVKY